MNVIHIPPPTITEHIEWFVASPAGFAIAVLALFLFLLLVWNFVIVPVIEWLVDLGERRHARDLYRARDEERRRLDAVIRTGGRS